MPWDVSTVDVLPRALAFHCLVCVFVDADYLI
jgi:hypothetical protein